MNPVVPEIGDSAARRLASHLREGAREVTGPQRSQILETLPKTLFISHTSLDEAFIKGGLPPRGESIWEVCTEAFPDPFYHSRQTGLADDYARIVGLALLTAVRVFVVWSENALRSDCVRAELLIAVEEGKSIAAYMAPGAPAFPVQGVPLIHDLQALRLFLNRWRPAAETSRL